MGTAERHAHLRDACDDEAAVAELHEITRDPALLTLAAESYTAPDAYWPRAGVLLEMAGADLDEARRARAARRPSRGLSGLGEQHAQGPR